jgi:hypothetical protein
MVSLCNVCVSFEEFYNGILFRKKALAKMRENPTALRAGFVEELGQLILFNAEQNHKPNENVVIKIIASGC